MKLSNFKAIVLELASKCHIRYYLHYNYPNTPPLMAIHLLGSHGKEVSSTAIADDLKKLGFTADRVSRDSIFWTIEKDEVIDDSL